MKIRPLRAKPSQRLSEEICLSEGFLEASAGSHKVLCRREGGSQESR